MPFSVGLLFTIEVEHQLEDMGGHHPTLDHLVHARFCVCYFLFQKRILPIRYLTLLILSNYNSNLGDQGVVA